MRLNFYPAISFSAACNLKCLSYMLIVDGFPFGRKKYVKEHVATMIAGYAVIVNNDSFNCAVLKECVRISMTFTP